MTPTSSEVFRRLASQYARIDEASWTSTTSAGLLRRGRKDLAGTEPELVAVDDARATIRVGTEEVTVDDGGPATASCTCPSLGPCRHIVSAGLWLGSTAEVADGSGREAPAAGLPTAGPPTPHEELMAVSAEDLVAHAGRAGHRWALTEIAGGATEIAIRSAGGEPVRIELVQPAVTFTYPGGSLAAIVADHPVPQLQRVRVLAVLAYQQAHGVHFEAPEAAPPTAAQRRHARERGDVRQEARRLVRETVIVGTAHVSPLLAARFEALALSARSTDQHRLAAMLRRLADHCTQLLARTAGAGERHVIADLALTHALVAALDAAPDPPPTRLAGLARSEYRAIGDVDLYGLGAHPWATASGHHGLTLLLWWPAARRFVTVSDARPVGVGGFDPISRYRKNLPFWQGLPTAAAGTGSRIRLRDPKINDQGRLSRSEDTSASALPVGYDELIDAVRPVTTWSSFRRPDPVRALLDPPDPHADWVIVAPHHAGSPSFDEVEQTARWPLFDAHGDELMATVHHTELARHAVTRLLGLGDLTPGTMVVGRLGADESRTATDSGAGRTIMPLSLIRPATSSESCVDTLFFDPPPPVVEPRRAPRPPQPTAQSPELPVVDPTIVDLLDWLERIIERGVGAGETAIRGELLARHGQLRARGLTVFPVDDDPPATTPDLLLRSYCIAAQVRSLHSG